MLFFGALPWARAPLSSGHEFVTTSPRHNPPPPSPTAQGEGRVWREGRPLTQGWVQILAPLRPCHDLPPNILLWSSYSVLKLCPGKSLKFPLYPNWEPPSRFTWDKTSLESLERVGTWGPNKTQPIPPSPRLDFFHFISWFISMTCIMRVQLRRAISSLQIFQEERICG